MEVTKDISPSNKQTHADEVSSKGGQLFKEECEGTVDIVWRKKDGT